MALPDFDSEVLNFLELAWKPTHDDGIANAHLDQARS